MKKENFCRVTPLYYYEGEITDFLNLNLSELLIALFCSETFTFPPQQVTVCLFTIKYSKNFLNI